MTRCWLLLCASLLVGCQSLLDLDEDYRLGVPAGGSGGSAGEGAGGSADAGAGGGAGDGATAGAAGDGGAAGDAGAAGAGNCTAPLDLCGETCVNTKSDRQHCGACDVQCEAGEDCKGGGCK